MYGSKVAGRAQQEGNALNGFHSLTDQLQEERKELRSDIAALRLVPAAEQPETTRLRLLVQQLGGHTMARAQRVLARRWKPLALPAFLLALTGAVLLVYVRVQVEATRANQLADEADLRGNAVATLAGDVRVLRSQIKAKGGTPAAPDPAKTVKNLPDRPAVPVPIPGPLDRRATRATQARQPPRSPHRPAPRERSAPRAPRGAGRTGR
ncbi:hypothetical protein AB0E08_04760 [Streptomyces sp. NPDC048281]|uniref:hypothetical protein n=1 Tax=Streptomyces sp. NPDC048281 TaxID=3154715 RepID=UPI00343908A3